MSHVERRMELSATDDAVLRAHDGRVSAALDNVRWVRRGFLRRLKRDTAN